jgi:hypothetical protein
LWAISYAKFRKNQRPQKQTVLLKIPQFSFKEMTRKIMSLSAFSLKKAQNFPGGPNSNLYINSTDYKTICKKFRHLFKIKFHFTFQENNENFGGKLSKQRALEKAI